MKQSLIFLIAVLVASGVALAQDAEREKLRQIERQKEEQKQREVRLQLDSAILLTDEGMYAEANEKYVYVLTNVRSVPSELTYHFGRNSYHLQKYSQSVDWLNKYLQLKGTSGQYYKEAVDWLKKAEQKVVEQQSQQALEASQVLSKNYQIDCGPTGKVTCPVCNGTTVVVKKTYLGESYKTCAYCAKQGYLTCDDYNKLVKGQLHPKSE